MNLINEVLNKMPDNLNDLEKARFIYIELGKILEFDTNTKNNTNEVYFKEKLKKEIDIENLESTKVNCHNWSDIYVKLLSLANIKAKKKANSHAWVIIYIDNYTICADATTSVNTDFSRIKANLKTNNFTLVDDEADKDLTNCMYDIEFEKELEKIDEKIGYNHLIETSYQQVESLKEEVNAIIDLKEKLEYIFKHIDLSNFGFFEGNEYIKYILEFCLNRNLYTKIKRATLSKTNINGDIDSIKCFTVENGYKLAYYIFIPKKGIYQMDRSVFAKLAQMGYGIENYKTITGIKDVENFKIYDHSPKDTFRLKKENLYTKMYANEKDIKPLINKKG